VPVRHTCNPSYSGGRDQEDYDLKPSQANVHEALSQKKHPKKRAGGVAQGVGPEFKLQYCIKKKRIGMSNYIRFNLCLFT
jgi:hypothetical protein